MKPITDSATLARVFDLLDRDYTPVHIAVLTGVSEISGVEAVAAVKAVRAANGAARRPEMPANTGRMDGARPSDRGEGGRVNDRPLAPVRTLTNGAAPL